MAGIILTTPRTGSEFLVKALDHHPEVECESELLKGIPTSEQREFLREKAQAGVWHKVFYFDLTPVTVMQIREENLPVIHLARSNIARQVVSWAVKVQMSEEEFWDKAYKEHPHKKKFTIKNLQWLKDRALDIAKGRDFFTRMFPNALRIVYPDFIKDNAVVNYGDICKYIGAKNLPLTCKMRKQMPKDYTKVIKNYAEVIDALGVERL